MRVGFNYPNSLNRFGSDFGPDIWASSSDWNRDNALEQAGNVSAIPLPPLFGHIDRNLANLKKMGFSVIRWFLLGNGNSYGPAPTAHAVPTGQLKPGGRMTTYTDYTFTPPPAVDKRFRRDFEELLKRFQTAQLQLIPSLVSFEFGSNVKAGPGNNNTGYGGRADAIRDQAKRKVFFDTMLTELLAASKPYAAQIYAWEVINEPVWLCQNIGALSNPMWAPHMPEMSWSTMNDFLKDAAQRIFNAGFKSTVGHRYYDDIARAEPGAIPQFHYYAEHQWYAVGQYKSDPANIKGAGLFSTSPRPFLGELDSAENRFGDPWTKDLGSGDSTSARLRLLESEGCELVLLWPDYAGCKPGRVSAATIAAEQETVMKNDVIKLLPSTRREVIAYTGGTLPPANE